MLNKYIIFAVTDREDTHLIRLENKSNSSEKIDLGGGFTTWEEADLMARLIHSREIINVEYVSMR